MWCSNWTPWVKRFGGIAAPSTTSASTYALARSSASSGLTGPARHRVRLDLRVSWCPTRAASPFLGTDVTNWSPDPASARWLGRSFQDARLFASLTVAENIAVALERHLEVRDPLGRGARTPGRSRLRDRGRLERSRVDRTGWHSVPTATSSSASSPPAAGASWDLAMAVAHEPSVLILDEPSSGIAQRETEALGPLLSRIQRGGRVQPAGDRTRHATRHRHRRPHRRPSSPVASSPLARRQRSSATHKSSPRTSVPRPRPSAARVLPRSSVQMAASG